MNKIQKLKEQQSKIAEPIKILEQKFIKENLKIKELKLEVGKIQDWNKPYNQIICPEGFRLIKIWELQYILDSSYTDKFLGEYKGKWNYFWCEQTKFDKLNNRSSGLLLNGDLNIISDWGVLVNSDDGGRVVFVRSIK